MRYIGYDLWNADGSITQRAIGRTAAPLTAVTITTSANRDTVVPSPFTGQLVFLTDTKKIQVWDGSAWLNITLAPPEPPTSLSATALSTTSLSVSFTAGADNGSAIANYKYALSTNGGSSYGAFTALDPADVTSPITISGLTAGTTYFIKLKAVNGMGDSVESSATSIATLVIPDAPTNLSASPSITTVDISFTPGSDNGYAISNYQYAISTNGGSTYGSFTALNPADVSSPITITGLTPNTAYYIKLKAVNSGGAGAESAAVSFTTLISVDYLVLAGGGGGGGTGSNGGGGGGAGGLRSTVTATGGGGVLESALGAALATNYTVTVGGGGNNGNYGTNGQDSIFSTITSIGGGGGGAPGQAGNVGGSGGGRGRDGSTAPQTNNTPNQGYPGGSIAPPGTGCGSAGGGGGAGGIGQTGQRDCGQTLENNASGGGVGLDVSITGTSTTYGGGGGGAFASCNWNGGVPQGGSGIGGNGSKSCIGQAGGNGVVNTGSGGGGGQQGDGGNVPAGNGSSGVVVLRYSSAHTITVGAGLSYSHINVAISGGYKYTRFTSGSGNVSWS